MWNLHWLDGARIAQRLTRQKRTYQSQILASGKGTQEDARGFEKKHTVSHSLLGPWDETSRSCGGTVKWCAGPSLGLPQTAHFMLDGGNRSETLEELTSKPMEASLLVKWCSD